MSARPEKIIDYIIMDAKDSIKLEDDIKNIIKNDEGWKPFGNLVVGVDEDGDFRVYQPMVRIKI